MKKIILPLIALGFFTTSCSEDKPIEKEEEVVHIEKEAEETPKGVVPTLPEGWELTTNQEIIYAAVSDSITFDQMGALSSKYGSMFGEVGKFLGSNQIEMVGMPLSRWSNFDPTGISIFDAGIPVAADVEGNDRIQILTIPSGKALKYSHFGSYAEMDPAYGSINAYFETGGLKQTGAPWEVYVTDPGAEPDTSKWLTEIWFPVSE